MEIENSSSSSSSSSAGAAAAGHVDTSGWKAAVGTMQYKPHQTQPTPSPGAGDRVFYESLYRENPSSDMGLIWCMEHGVFLIDEHTRLIPRYLEAKSRKRAGGGGAGITSPMKSSSSSSSAVAGVKAPKSGATSKADKGRIIDSTAGPSDIGMSVGGTEGIGTMTL